MAERASTPPTQFVAAHGAGADWRLCAKACLDGLGHRPARANLGLLYATDALAGDLSSIVTLLRGATGIEHWLGGIGIGIAAGDREIYDQPALCVLLAALPDDGFRVFPPVGAPANTGGFDDLRGALHGWMETRRPAVGLVHGDPRTPGIERIIADVAAGTGAFLVGALGASRGAAPQIADQVAEGGLSGALFAPGIEVAVGLTQGCSPIGAPRTITEADAHVIHAIDGRPALDVFKEDIGELLARDLRRIGGYIYAGFPVEGSDTGDYLVRDLTGLDTRHGWIGVGEAVEAGRRIIFCRRDPDTARDDLTRMLRDVKRRAGSAPKAAVYISCVARGRHLFGPHSEELAMVRAALGDVPLAGVFAGGEICNDRLYGHTGVLAVFL